MTRLTRALPAFIAGITLSLLTLPALAATVPAEDIVAGLDDFEDAELQVEWHNDALVLDGDVPEEQIDALVIEAAKLSGAKTIINKLYIS